MSARNARLVPVDSIGKSWITEARHSATRHFPEAVLLQHLTPQVAETLKQVAAESRDTSQRVYTQAEVIRAIELAQRPLLLALAQRVAHLNRDAGEIGAGMLASLVDDARRALGGAA